MIRERTLKIVLLVVGLLFLIGVYGLIGRVPPADQMLGSVYATLGVFLLLAARNPSANRSLIAFAAWSSLVHGAVMAVQAIYSTIRTHISWSPYFHFLSLVSRWSCWRRERHR